MRIALTILLLALAWPTWAQPVLHGGPVRVLALSADGAWLLSGGFDGRLVVQEAVPAGAEAAPAPRRAFPDGVPGNGPEAPPRGPGGPPRAVLAHSGGVTAALPLPDGGWASGGEDGQVILWPAIGPEAPPRRLEAAGAPVAALALRGATLFSGGRDGELRLRNLGTGEVRRLVPGAATALALRDDGQPVAAGAEGMVRLWRPEGGVEVLAQFGLPVTALLPLPGDLLVVGTAGGGLVLLDPDGRRRELAAGTRPVTALAATPDGRLLAAASLPGVVTLWSLPDGRLRQTLAGEGGPVWSVALSPDGGTAWTGGSDGRVRRWAVRGGQALDGPGPVAGASAEARILAADPRGARAFRACAVCHALDAAEVPRAGPHLGGVFGRRMGSLPGYAYSERLARGDILWTPDTVADLFTRGPDVVTPGTRMPTQRVTDPEEMAALLRLLGAASPGAASAAPGAAGAAATSPALPAAPPPR
ncbi:c-type cytochrome [Roseomonas sp. BN140053]|uniref:c-type cytochrome n=1 Tax=Roseomonas sp. BN140053 TaxID=3391898 RepID=UPI0039EC1A80